MVEPMKPKFRQALLDEHPGLDEKIIDRLEALTIQRLEVNPATDTTRINELDRERERIIRDFLPRMNRVVRRFSL